MALKLRTIYILLAVVPRLNVTQCRYNVDEAGISKSPMEMQARKKPLELDCKVPDRKPGMLSR